MTQSDIINNNFSKAFECIKCSNAYDTGEVLSEEKLFKQISERKHSTFDLSKFTIVGSPTITDDGVASGFSTPNYVKVPYVADRSKPWIQYIEFTTSSDVTTEQRIWVEERPTLNSYTSRIILDSSKKIAYRFTSDGASFIGGSINRVGTHIIQPNTKYILKAEFTGTRYNMYLSINGSEYELDYTIVNTAPMQNFPSMLGFWSEYPFLGSIDLKNFSITVDGKEVFSGNKTGIDVINDIEIPYTLSKTGSKIVDVAYRDRVIDLYEQQGHARYYTIDEENKNFTLPMGEIYGMIGDFSSTGGSGLELCDIGMALYVDETKGLRRYLNGQIVDRNTNTEAFFTRLQEITTLHPSLLCTEEEWQTAKTMSAFGQVGKFVFNYSGDKIVSVRLPRVVNVQGLFDLQNLGMMVNESLPNIKAGKITTSDWGGIETEVTGAWEGSSHPNYTNLNSGNTATEFFLSFNASRSSSTYQDGAPVQQEAIQYPYFIQIATGSETENNIINEIELNNPYSLFDSKYSDHELNNLSWLKSEGQWNAKSVYPEAYDKLLKVYNGTETVEGLSVKLSTETYTDYDFVLNTTDETFRLPLLDGSEDLPSDTILKSIDNTTLPVGNTTLFTASYNGSVSMKAYSTTGNNTVIVNRNNAFVGSAGFPNNAYSQSTISFDVKRNDVVSISLDQGTVGYNYQYYKTVGNGSLYFYVGETVQNANLIDAGRISEVIPNKLDKKQLYNKITNCLLEVPQRIKLELNNGTLTLKAGSQVIVPNGDGVFDEIEITSDLTFGGSSIDWSSTKWLVLTPNGILFVNNGEYTSGATYTGGTYCIWYDTTNNSVKYTPNGGSTWISGYSLPLAQITTTSGIGVTSIDQIFNGIGYIGSTVWIDKGVKGLIPNGRNEDGSLKNIEYTTTSVLLNSSMHLWGGQNTLNIMLYQGRIVVQDVNRFSKNKETPVSNPQYVYSYDEEDNYWYYSTDNGVNWVIQHFITIGSLTEVASNKSVSSFQPKLPFRAVDYNDKSEISGWGMPSNKYINLTLGASGSTYTAPANGWFYANAESTSTNQYMNLGTGIGVINLYTQCYSSAIGQQMNLYIPVKRGEVMKCYYSVTPNILKFIYAEGSK